MAVSRTLTTRAHSGKNKPTAIMYKLALLPLLFAAVSAGYLEDAYGHGGSYGYSGLGYGSAYGAGYDGYGGYGYGGYAHAAPIAYSAPIVKTYAHAPVATSYQNTYQVSKAALAVAPVHYAAPAIVKAPVAVAAPAYGHSLAHSYSASAYPSYGLGYGHGYGYGGYGLGYGSGYGGYDSHYL